MINSKARFSKKIKLQNEEKNQKFSKEAGVYIICACENDSELTDIPIKRFIGEDRRGILYIGKGVKMHGRVSEFCRYIKADSKVNKNWNHPGGKRLWHILQNDENKQKINNDISLDNLYVTFIEVEIKQGDAPTDKAEEKEQELLRLYFKEYGEVPPLNGTLELAKSGV